MGSVPLHVIAVKSFVATRSCFLVPVTEILRNSASHRAETSFTGLCQAGVPPRIEGVCVPVKWTRNEARRRLEERRRAKRLWGGGCEVAGKSGTARCHCRAKRLEADCPIVAGPTERGYDS